MTALPYWHVEFMNAEDAAHALSVGKHLPLGKNAQVEPSKNWPQGLPDPSARHQIITRKSTLDHGTEENSMRLQDIHDDCLESIDTCV